MAAKGGLLLRIIIHKHYTITLRSNSSAERKEMMVGLCENNQKFLTILYTFNMEIIRTTEI